jgi:cytoskeleton protein RodZ
MTDFPNENSMSVLPSSPGALIKAAREKAGLHLAILSVNLKVSIKQLEALEADQFDKLLEPVFARALAAKVCRVLKLDSSQVLALMPAVPNGLKPLNLIQTEPGNSFSTTRIDRRSVMHLGSTKLWVTVLVLFILSLGISNDWFEGVFQIKSAPETVEVIPMMPPVQEPVAPEPAQADLPKAMVFESPVSIQPPGTQSSSTTVMPEFKK